MLDFDGADNEGARESAVFYFFLVKKCPHEMGSISRRQRRNTCYRNRNGLINRSNYRPAFRAN